MKQYNISVSIIVPVYNVERYLDRCVKSLIAQTYQNIEIILVDDGSPDKCPQICDLWAEKDSRIRVIHKENGGLSDARNKGIDCAQGDYIAFVDSDDYIDTGMIETMIDALVRTGAEIACCGRYHIRKGGIYREHALKKEKVISSQEAIRQILLYGYVEEAAWDKLYKSSLFENIRYPVGEINEDAVTTPFLIQKCKKIVHVGKALYYYCQNEGSITNSRYKEANHVYIKHLEVLDAFISTYYSSLKNELKVLKGRYAINNLFWLVMDKNNFLVFEDDYKKYMQILRSSYFWIAIDYRIALDYKIKGFLLMLEIFAPIRNLMKGIRYE